MKLFLELLRFPGKLISKYKDFDWRDAHEELVLRSTLMITGIVTVAFSLLALLFGFQVERGWFGSLVYGMVMGLLVVGFLFIIGSWFLKPSSMEAVIVFSSFVPAPLLVMQAVIVLVCIYEVARNREGS